MENLINDTRKFEKRNLNSDGILNFAVNQGKCVDNILKKNFMRLRVYLKKTTRSLKPVRTRPGIMYGLCKVHP